MIFKCFFTLFLSLALAASGYCFDIIYPLTGNEFMPVNKGNIHIELSSKTTSYENIESGDGETDTQTTALYGAYDLTDKVSFNVEIPYVYVENNSTNHDALGDISIGFKYQSSNQETSFLNSFINFTTVTPTGDSPYENSTKLATGSGGYAFKPEVTLAKTVKESLIFLSLFYQYNLPIEDLSYRQYNTDGEAGVELHRVEPGDEYGGSIGFVEIIHKNISCMIRYNLHRSLDNDYDWNGRDDYKSGGSDFSTLSTGLGFQFPSKLAVFTTFSVGVGNEAPDYEIELSVAF